MQLPEKVNPSLLKNIKNLPPQEQEKVLKLLKELNEAESKEKARDGFMPFIKKVWPAFIEGRHHKLMAEAFERVINGDLKRLIINMPPRHTKSEFAHICSQHGFWDKRQIKRLFKLLTLPNYPLVLAERFVT